MQGRPYFGPGGREGGRGNREGEGEREREIKNNDVFQSLTTYLALGSLEQWYQAGQYQGCKKRKSTHTSRQVYFIKSIIKEERERENCMQIFNMLSRLSASSIAYAFMY